MSKPRRAPVSLGKAVARVADAIIDKGSKLEIGDEGAFSTREREALVRWLRKVGGFPDGDIVADMIMISINAELERRGSDLRIRWTPEELVIFRARAEES
jgi:hypothetical protein